MDERHATRPSYCVPTHAAFAVNLVAEATFLDSQNADVIALEAKPIQQCLAISDLLNVRMLICTVSLALLASACASNAIQVSEPPATSTTTTTTTTSEAALATPNVDDLPTIALAEAKGPPRTASTDTTDPAPRQYFSDLPELQLHPVTPISELPPHPFPKFSTDVQQTAVNRHEEYNQVFGAPFLSGDELDEYDIVDVDFWRLLPSHPSITYVYQCRDGRPGYVSHFAHEDLSFTNSSKRADFLGALSTDASTGTTTFGRPLQADQQRAFVGVLRPTGIGGALAGADYIHRFENGDGHFSAQNWIRYGHYQYLTFTDADVVVDVLVQAPSVDHRDDRFPETAPTITADSVDPLVLVDHQRVQDRFACGHELTALVVDEIRRIELELR